MILIERRLKKTNYLERELLKKNSVGSFKLFKKRNEHHSFSSNFDFRF